MNETSVALVSPSQRSDWTEGCALSSSFVSTRAESPHQRVALPYSVGNEIVCCLSSLCLDKQVRTLGQKSISVSGLDPRGDDKTR